MRGGYGALACSEDAMRAYVGWDGPCALRCSVRRRSEAWNTPASLTKRSRKVPIWARASSVRRAGSRSNWNSAMAHRVSSSRRWFASMLVQESRSRCRASFVLDAVLHVAAGCVEAAVDRFGSATEVGHDVACVVAWLAAGVVGDLALDDHSACALPGLGAIVGLGVAAGARAGHGVLGSRAGNPC